MHEIPSDHKKTVFYYEGGQTWNRLPGKVVQSSSVEILKIQLDTVLDNLL